jgi:type IV pilus assembly protein PilN
MIRINLMSSQIAPSSMEGAEGFADFEQDASQVEKQGALRLVMILILPLALILYENQNLPDLKTQLRNQNKRMQELTKKNQEAKSAVEEIAKFKEDQTRLQNQIDTLESLQKERLREVKILDNIQRDIPKKVWLSRVEFKEGNIMIAGSASTDLELTLFMENLSRSVFLQNVDLVKSVDVTGDASGLKQFEIVCRIDRPQFIKAEAKKK